MRGQSGRPRTHFSSGRLAREPPALGGPRPRRAAGRGRARPVLGLAVKGRVNPGPCAFPRDSAPRDYSNALWYALHALWIEYSRSRSSGDNVLTQFVTTISSSRFSTTCWSRHRTIAFSCSFNATLYPDPLQLNRLPDSPTAGTAEHNLQLLEARESASTPRRQQEEHIRPHPRPDFASTPRTNQRPNLDGLSKRHPSTRPAGQSTRSCTAGR
jgi:hypothetical protein